MHQEASCATTRSSTSTTARTCQTRCRGACNRCVLSVLGGLHQHAQCWHHMILCVFRRQVHLVSICDGVDSIRKKIELQIDPSQPWRPHCTIFSRNGHLIKVRCGSKVLWNSFCTERGALCANTDDTAHAITTDVASTPLVLPSRCGTSAFRPALLFLIWSFWLANQVCCTLKAILRSCVCLPWCATCTLESHLCGQVGEETNMSGRAYCGVSPCSQRPCVTKRYAISRVKLDAACLRLRLIPHA